GLRPSRFRFECDLAIDVPHTADIDERMSRGVFIEPIRDVVRPARLPASPSDAIPHGTEIHPPVQQQRPSHPHRSHTSLPFAISRLALWLLSSFLIRSL